MLTSELLAEAEIILNQSERDRLVNLLGRGYGFDEIVDHATKTVKQNIIRETSSLPGIAGLRGISFDSISADFIMADLKLVVRFQAALLKKAIDPTLELTSFFAVIDSLVVEVPTTFDAKVLAIKNLHHFGLLLFAIADTSAFKQIVNNIFSDTSDGDAINFVNSMLLDDSTGFHSQAWVYFYKIQFDRTFITLKKFFERSFGTAAGMDIDAAFNGGSAQLKAIGLINLALKIDPQSATMLQLKDILTSNSESTELFFKNKIGNLLNMLRPNVANVLGVPSGN